MKESGQAKLDYELSNIQLEYEVIHSKQLSLMNQRQIQVHA